jgi:hypothetical protein
MERRIHPTYAASVRRIMAKPSGGANAVEQTRLGWLRRTCLVKREIVAASTAADGL